MSEWTGEASIETTAAAHVVWSLLADVATWRSWNAGVAAIELHGPFATGSTFRMHLPDGTTLHTRLLDVEVDRGFVDETIVADVCVRVAHRLVAIADGGTRIVYSTTVSGPDAASVGDSVTADFADVLAALKRQAERSTPLADAEPHAQR